MEKAKEEDQGAVALVVDLALKLKRSFPPWLLNTGQKELGKEQGVTEADSRSSDVEAGERACRSSDV